MSVDPGNGMPPDGSGGPDDNAQRAIRDYLRHGPETRTGSTSAPVFASQSRPGMRQLVRGAQSLVGDMRIDLRCAERRVAEDLLNAAQVGATLQQVRSRCVPETVRADVCPALDGSEPVVDDPSHGSRVNAAAACPEEERRPAGVGAQLRPRPVDPRPYRDRGRRAVGHRSFLAPLAEDADDPTLAVEVVEVEPGQLANSDAGRVEQFEDRKVTQSHHAVIRD